MDEEIRRYLIVYKSGLDGLTIRQIVENNKSGVYHFDKVNREIRARIPDSRVALIREAAWLEKIEEDPL